MNDTVLEGGMLIRIKSVTQQLTTRHSTNGMNEIPMVKIVEPIFIGVMGVGVAVEIMSGGVLHSVLVTSILDDIRTRGTLAISDLRGTPLCYT